jgi:hypothetical protein
MARLNRPGGTAAEREGARARVRGGRNGPLCFSTQKSRGGGPMTGYDRDLRYLSYRARARTPYNTKPGHTRSLTERSGDMGDTRRIRRNPVIPRHTKETKETKQLTVASIRR